MTIIDNRMHSVQDQRLKIGQHLPVAACRSLPLFGKIRHMKNSPFLGTNYYYLISWGEFFQRVTVSPDADLGRVLAKLMGIGL